MHKKIWSLHNWVGLYAGVVIAVLSLTGVVALFKFDIDRALNPSLFKIQPQENYARISPLVDSLRMVHGAEHHRSVRIGSESNESWSLIFFNAKNILKPKFTEVFIDPYTAKVLGQRDVYKSTAFFIRNLHVRLYDSLIGRQIVGISGIALLLSTVTGFWIYGGFMKKQFFGVIRQKNLRIRMADYHKLIGVTTLFFNLIIAITGAWLGLQVYLEPLVTEQRPGQFILKDKPLSKADDIAYPVDYDQVYAKTKDYFPELVPHTMSASTDGSRKITIYGTVARTAFERNRFSLTLDKKDLTELNRFDIRKASWGNKLYFIQESMHFGDYGGWFVKIIYAFFGTTSGFLALSGFVVYLKRTDRKRKKGSNYLDIKPLLLRWVYGISGFMILLYLLHLIFGIVVPSLLVMALLYLSLLVLLIRALYLFIRRKWFSVTKPN
jgi:uncharacterized iron-regulated membrane protein